MSNDNSNRVLSRIGAHELTPEEMNKVDGGRLLTVPSVTFTGPIYNPDFSLDS